MKIGFVSTDYFQAQSVGTWSGIPFHMARALEGAGLEIIHLQAPAKSDTWPAQLVFAYWRLVRRRRYLRDRRPAYLRRLGTEASAAADAAGVDALFAPTSLPVAELGGSRPAFFWTDATFTAMVDFYDSFSHLAPVSLQSGREADVQALRRCTAAFYSSDWAAESARRFATVPTSRIKMVPFGANIDSAPPSALVTESLRDRHPAHPRLLFAGVDWQRKGGAFACEVVRQARARGVEAELHIVGCSPPAGSIPDASGIFVHGFVSKANVDGRDKLRQLLMNSEWLILPAKAECFGIVFAEAAAFAVPSLAFRVGGIPSAIRAGKTGILFEPGTPATAWVDLLVRYAQAPEHYRRLAAAARRDFETRLNWETAGRAVAACIREAMAQVAPRAALARTPPGEEPP